MSEATKAERWAVRLLCCGHEAGVLEFRSWAEAEVVRKEYSSGQHVSPRAFSTHKAEGGHKRVGVLTHEVPGEVPYPSRPCPDCGGAGHIRGAWCPTCVRFSES